MIGVEGEVENQNKSGVALGCKPKTRLISEKRGCRFKLLSVGDVVVKTRDSFAVFVIIELDDNKWIDIVKEKSEIFLLINVNVIQSSI